MNVLLDRGADVNMSMTNGTTALIAASNRGYSGIVSLLLEHGAKVDAATDETTALMCACRNGFTDIAFLLLDAGIEVDAVNSKGWSSLLMAADKGCYQILSRLIKMGAKVNIQSNDADWTPLMSASANGFVDIAEKLIAEGAEVNSQQAGGWSPLMIAVRAGHSSIVRLLLKHNAEIFDSKEQIRPDLHADQLRDVPDGAVPLIGAVLGGHTEIVSLLLQHGANPTTRSSRGKTALMIAAANGSGADINVLLKDSSAVPILEDFGYTLLRIGWVQVRGFLGAGSSRRGENKLGPAAMPRSQRKVE